MVLMFCPKCGTQRENAANRYCRTCGYDFGATINCPRCNQPRENMSNQFCMRCGYDFGLPRPSGNVPPQYNQQPQPKGYWSTGRLVLGIISMVLFFLIVFQSCAVGLLNTFDSTGATTGTSGVFVAFSVLISGIVGVATRNSSSKTGPFVAGGFYVWAAILTIGTGDTYPDLPIWGFISFVFGIVFIIAAVRGPLDRAYNSPNKPPRKDGQFYTSAGIWDNRVAGSDPISFRCPCCKFYIVFPKEQILQNRQLTCYLCSKSFDTSRIK